MKKIASTSIMILFAVGASTISSAATDICLRSRDIKDTVTPDATTIVFHMYNGDVWRNKLQTPCPDLIFDGFAWNLHSTGDVCENEQSIRVLHSGQICMLGKFEKLPRIAKAK